MARKKNTLLDLSRRERQAMDIVYAMERATATDVHERLPDPPSYSSVRSMLSLLEEKKLLCHEREGQRYVYLPTVPREKASKTSLKHLVDTFFEGSTQATVAALLQIDDSNIEQDSVDRIMQMIEKAKEEGR